MDAVGHVWLDQVHCIGSELTLDLCRHNEFGNHNCDPRKAASVVCSKRTYNSSIAANIFSQRISMQPNLVSSPKTNSYDQQTPTICTIRAHSPCPNNAARSKCKTSTTRKTPARVLCIASSPARWPNVATIHGRLAFVRMAPRVDRRTNAEPLSLVPFMCSRPLTVSNPNWPISITRCVLATICWTIRIRSNGTWPSSVDTFTSNSVPVGGPTMTLRSLCSKKRSSSTIWCNRFVCQRPTLRTVRAIRVPSPDGVRFERVFLVI